MIRSPKHIIFLIACAVVSPKVLAATEPEWCDEQWATVSAQEPADSGRGKGQLLAAWRNLEGSCKGTGIYEARLATIFMLMGDYEKARATVDSALSNSTVRPGYRAMAEMVKLTADSREMLASPNPNGKALADLDKRAVKLIETYPNYQPFYGFVGNLRMRLGNYKDAIGPLERASQFEDGKRWDMYRHLTVACSSEGLYKKALAYADKAYEMNKAVTSDEEFMYALALAYAAADNVDAAKDTLSLILNKKPSLSGDKRFQDAVQKAKVLSGGKLK